jgi:hypothetical protein
MIKKKSKIIPLHPLNQNDEIIKGITKDNLEQLSRDLGELKDMIDGHFGGVVGEEE